MFVELFTYIFIGKVALGELKMMYEKHREHVGTCKRRLSPDTLRKRVQTLWTVKCTDLESAPFLNNISFKFDPTTLSIGGVSNSFLSWTIGALCMSSEGRHTCVSCVSDHH